MKRSTEIARIFLFSLCFCLVLAGQALGEQLFKDDFEQDAIGAEPSKWEVGQGDSVAKVIEDPTDSDNKIFKTTGRLNGGDAGRHYIIGDESWKDYIAEWDWMFLQDGYYGIAFRFQERDNYYLVDRRLGGIDIQLYSRKNAGWGLMMGGQYPNDIDVWYRCRLEIMGESFIFKIKERDDSTPFSEIEPLLEANDAEFDSGGIANAGVTYIDNIVVGETEDDLTAAVQARDKLSITWGEIKSLNQ